MELPVPWATLAGLGEARASVPSFSVTTAVARCGMGPAKNIIMHGTPPDAAPIAGKRLLVVEDEFLILLDIQSTLETAGAKSVVTASRVQDALNVISDSEKIGARFDAALLDLKLDHESSAPIAERLTSAGVPFIFLTGAPTDVELAKQFGSAPIVGKPFDSAALLAALSNAMAAKD